VDGALDFLLQVGSAALMACVSEGLAAARSRGSRGSRRGGGSGNRVTAPLAAAEPLAAADPRAVLEAVASNVQLQREHVIQRELIEAGVASTADARLRQKMSETFAAMLQGTGPSFSVLQGARLCRAVAESALLTPCACPPL